MVGIHKKMTKNTFNINYLISKNEKESIIKINNANQFETDVIKDSWISIIIGDYEYGGFPVNETEGGDELLDLWFTSFKEVYNQLKSNTEVILNYWENPFDYFEFIIEDKNISVRFLRKKLLIENQRIQNNIVCGVDLIAETILSTDSFLKTIKESVNNYWDEVARLNPILCDFTRTKKIFS